MDRRSFVGMAIAGAAGPFLQRVARAQPISKVQNVA